jgi:hypothetical protein
MLLIDLSDLFSDSVYCMLDNRDELILSKFFFWILSQPGQKNVLRLLNSTG